jgi:serine protease Do
MFVRHLTAALAAAGLIGSAVGYSAASMENTTRSDHAIRHVAGPAASVQTRAGLPDFSALVTRYGPAVVNITVTEQTAADQFVPNFPQLDPDDPFYQFFKRFNPPRPRAVPMQGVGSGFIVRADGVILTNAHVVDGAQEVDVKLTDHRELKAKVLGVDPQSDIAVIKIDAKNLPTVKLGNPAAVKVGDWVAAIGSPFGFENSVTQGIVSAKARTLPDESYVPFIQTDVAVNPGNSGGPLFDLNGEVIGINSQIYSRTGGYEGLSFAIPIDIAVNVEQQILKYGKVTRGHLGVAIQQVTQGLADSFGMPSPNGALVSSVEPGSPAAKAGLKPGDIITKLDGQQVTDSASLPAQIAQTKPGTRLTIQVLRGGKPHDVEVTLGTLKERPLARASGSEQDHKALGLTVRPLTPQERRETGDDHGLLVEEADGAAARAGIRPGDVILSVNAVPVDDARRLRELVQNSGGHVAVLVERDGVRQYVPVEAG